MVNSRVLRNKDKAYIELPPEMSSLGEVEIFQLRNGYYLLSVPLGSSNQTVDSPAQKAKITEQEIIVLKKLLGIRFSDRSPANVAKMLDDGERATLAELERKGLANVFKGKKYKDGVYNIPDSAYALINHKEQKQTVQQTPEQKPNGQQISSAGPNALSSRGFIILQDKRDAMMLSTQLEHEMKNGKVLGIKGFDSKFYMVTRDYFNNAQQKISAALSTEMDSASIAASAKLEPEGCVAVLRLMSENGDIIEKKKGIFAPI